MFRPRRPAGAAFGSAANFIEFSDFDILCFVRLDLRIISEGIVSQETSFFGSYAATVDIVSAIGT